MRAIALHGLLQTALDFEGYLPAMTATFVVHLFAPKCDRTDAQRTELTGDRGGGEAPPAGVRVERKVRRAHSVLGLDSFAADVMAVLWG